MPENIIFPAEKRRPSKFLSIKGQTLKMVALTGAISTLAWLLINLFLANGAPKGLDIIDYLTALRNPGQVINCWGDSLSFGMGAKFDFGYPEMLRDALRRVVINNGRNGETTKRIGNRMLSRLYGLDRGVTIIWAGRNNIAYHKKEPELAINEVTSDIAAMIASLPENSHYLVMGVLNAAVPEEASGTKPYDAVVTINAKLAATYGDRFVPIRDILVDAYNPKNKADLDAHGAGETPVSLRHDDVHLNDAGYHLVAQVLEDQISARHW